MFKILSLDGGGSWSILQLLTLKDRYGGETKGHSILRVFDLVIANSGGSIILAALAENWTLNKAISLFEDQSIREQIFSTNSFKERFFPIDYIRLLLPFGPKYSSKRKGEAFQKLFPKVNKHQMKALPKFIGKANLKIIVCTYDALNNRAKLFKSYAENDQFDSVKLTQAIHGSSNAPIQYFDFPARFKAKESGIFYELWDGALGGFNNPVAAGVMEAIKLGHQRKDMHVISIGTGNKLMSMVDKDAFYTIKETAVRKRKKKFRLDLLKKQLQFFAKSILNQAKTILYEPPDWANAVGYTMLFADDYNNPNNIERYVRLSPMIHYDQNSDPVFIETINQLYQLDMDLTTKSDIKLLFDCFGLWKKGILKNQPIEYQVSRENKLNLLLGHKTYDHAFSIFKQDVFDIN